MANLTLPKLLVILCGLVALLMIHPEVAAADDDEDENQYETYILYFRPTQNAPPGASGKMKISVDASRGDTRVKFSVREEGRRRPRGFCRQAPRIPTGWQRGLPARPPGRPVHRRHGHRPRSVVRD